MIAYYFEQAIGNLTRNKVLTALMVLLVGIGIGASMTTLTTLRAMSSDPIPDRSSQLFKPQIDLFGPASGGNPSEPLQLSQLPYQDSVALMQAKRGTRQTAMYAIQLDVTPPTGRSFQAIGRAVYSDFFTMFEVPFRSGSPWTYSEDDMHENVVVLSAQLANRLFPGLSAVGRTIGLHAHEYRVVGVLDHWSPVPRYYDIRMSAFAKTEEFFIPFTTAIDQQIESSDDVGNGCQITPPTKQTGWGAYRNSHCFWTDFWVELPTPASVRNYRAFLFSYADEQRRLGRFHWPTRVGLYDVHDWLSMHHIVPDETLIVNLMSAGFLIVCLINAAGLMLAKFSGRTRELSIRRALGASRKQILLQSLTETMLVGVIGGVLGLGLMYAGLENERLSLAVADEKLALNSLTHVDMGMVGIAVAVAILASVCAGLYPAWRASHVQPAFHLKIM